MPFTSRRDLLNSLTVSQLRAIGGKYDIHLPVTTTKTGIISRLMSLSKTVIEKEVHSHN